MLCWVSIGQELAGKVEVETVAGPQSQQQAMGRGRSEDSSREGRPENRRNDAWGLAERLSRG